MTVTSLVIGCVCFALGYLTGRLDSLCRLLGNGGPPPKVGFFADSAPLCRRQQNGAAKISIDERKVVTEIRTDTLQKTQDIQLGKQVVASDDINASVSKLAQLKRS